MLVEMIPFQSFLAKYLFRLLSLIKLDFTETFKPDLSLEPHPDFFRDPTFFFII
jgi:hypothetical protein